MRRFIVCFIFILTITIGLGYAKPVEALYIVAPSDVSVSYISDTSIKLNYKTNNTNSNYKVQIFNSTLGKIYTTEVNTTSYTVTGLEFGKTYNFYLRIYYKTSTAKYKSNWTSVISATPKADAPVINSITSGDKSLTLNYKVTGSPKGVQIYNSNTKKVTSTTNLSTYKVTGLTNGTTYKFLIRNYYDNSAYGPWSATKSGAPKGSGSSSSNSSDSVKSIIDTVVKKQKKYSKLKTLKNFNTSNCKKVWSHKTCNGCSNSYFITQSFAYLGNEKYAVTFITRSNSARIATYNKNKFMKKSSATTALGHGNGMTYNPNTGYLYSVNLGTSKKVTIYKASTLTKVKTRTLKYGSAAIGYDIHANRYYGGSSKGIRIFNSNLNYVKTISRKRKGTLQDMAGYHGVAFTITMQGNYIDMYRVSDKAYLGSYKVNMGELESLAVDEDGHLLLLIYGSGKDNKIYKTNMKLSF